MSCVAWAVGVGACLGASACGEEFRLAETPADACTALRFSGGQFVEVPHASDLDLPATFTVEARFFFEDLPPEADIVSHHAYGQSGYAITLLAEGLQILIFRDTQQLYDTGDPVARGVWHHVAVESNGQETVTYLDGLEAIRRGGAAGEAPRPNPGPLRIGASAEADGFYFNGLIDEVRLSRSVRYSNEFDLPGEPWTADSDTIALWHFDEADGQAVQDAVGTHAGTLGSSSATELEDPVREPNHCLAAITRPTPL